MFSLCFLFTCPFLLLLPSVLLAIIECYIFSSFHMFRTSHSACQKIGFALSKCLQPSFVVSHLFSWHVRGTEQMCLYHLYQPPFRIWVLLTVLFLTSREQDTVPVRWRRKSTKCSYKSQSCHYSCRVYPRSKARVTTLEMNATSVSSGSGSARSWNVLGHSDGSTATGSLGSHGPGSSDDNREIQDEDLIRSQAPKMNYREVSEFIAKQVPCRSGLFVKHEPNVKTLLLDIKMMVFPVLLTVFSAKPIQLSLSVNPNQLKTESLEINLRLCGENPLTNLKFSSLKKMTKVLSLSQRLMLAQKSSAVFKFAPLRSGQA